MDRAPRHLVLTCLLLTCACSGPSPEADAGLDAGPADSGSAADAGLDAGPDAGADAGPPSDAGDFDHCTLVSVGDFEFTDEQDVRTIYSAPITPTLMRGRVERLYLRLQDFTMGEGTYDLASERNRDVFYCNQCLQGVEVLGDGSARVHFHNLAGTVVSRSNWFERRLDFTITGLVLEEVDGENGPVAGGSCVRFDTIEFAGVFPPEDWTCPPADYGDGATCHCGCGAFDPDCGPQCELFEPGCDPSNPGFLPQTGCESGQLCSTSGRCLEPCEHEGSTPCAEGICSPTSEGDVCLDAADVDSAAFDAECETVIGSLGFPLRRLCAPTDGFARGQCDDLTNHCRALCEGPNDCDPSELCAEYEIGDPTGQCIPSEDPDG